MPVARGGLPGPQALNRDAGKLRMDLLPVEFLRATARALTFGASKYEDFGYLRGDGLDPSRVYAALWRHMLDWRMGVPADDESGLSHLDHACACLAMLVHLGQDEKAREPAAVFPQKPSDLAGLAKREAIGSFLNPTHPTASTEVSDVG